MGKKMSDPAERKVPVLRFKGFTDAWEQRELGDYLKTSKAKNLDGTFDKDDVYSVSGEYGVVNQIKFQGRSFAGTSVLPYKIVRTGEVVYTKSPLKANPYGIVKSNFCADGIVSTLYAVYSPNGDTCVNFIQRHFESDDRLNRYLKPLVNKGAKNDMKISDENVLRGDVIFPLGSEQAKIGNFFRTFDDTITLHQRKLDGLKELKKGYLQQMFPQAGEHVPRLRFAGFEGDWEQQKLESLFCERSSKGGEGELISVTINSGVVRTSTLQRKDNSSSDKSGYKKVEIGDIAYNTMRMWQGASGRSSYSGILSPAYTVVTPKHEMCSVFFSYMFKLTNMLQLFQRNSQGLTSDTWNLKFPLFGSISVMIPCPEEQSTIGNFFCAFDGQIAAQSKKIDQLKQLKRAYLQKMFI